MQTQTLQIRLQPKQELFNSSPADIAIMGGAAGGGKTYSLLVEPLRYLTKVAGFGAVIFRRSFPEIINLGGLWDEARDMYENFNGEPNLTRMDITLPPFENRVRFSHLQYDRNVFDWKGAQIPLIEFDQLETFTENQFFYLLTRNRSTCGVRPYIRATANPEPNWLAEFLDWWIAPDGYANMERAGVLRWFIRIKDQLIWSNDPEEIIAEHPDARPKSVTFIPSTIYDNQILMEKDPDYLANLMAQPEIDRERLLGDPIRGGNWKIKPSAGNIFNRDWFEKTDFIPMGGKECRYWDFAATEKKYENNKNDPDFTAGVSMRKVGDMYYVTDVVYGQLAPKDVDELFYNTTVEDWERCKRDGTSYSCRWELEPGSASIRESRRLVTTVSMVDSGSVRKTGDKITEWKPLSAQAKNGNVRVKRAEWNDDYIYHMHGQPDLNHDDMADASAGTYNELSVPKGADLIAFVGEEKDDNN